jgi:hypothetical protein
MWMSMKQSFTLSKTNQTDQLDDLTRLVLWSLRYWSTHSNMHRSIIVSQSVWMHCLNNHSNWWSLHTHTHTVSNKNILDICGYIDQDIFYFIRNQLTIGKMYCSSQNLHWICKKWKLKNIIERLFQYVVIYKTQWLCLKSINECVLYDMSELSRIHEDYKKKLFKEKDVTIECLC